MKKILLIIAIHFFVIELFAHSSIKGKVSEAHTKESLQGIYIKIVELDKVAITDNSGEFEFNELSSGKYTLQFFSIGHSLKTEIVELKSNEIITLAIFLEAAVMQLSEVVIDCNKESAFNSISSIDFKLRPINTTQDLLRLVPGLFIAQHAGGGKAEQIFLRGFDVDHGTDVSIKVDGMPVNMVSHAHGQGYADLHFVIPETVNSMSFSKGPYEANVGNFNTAGAVNFYTKNNLSSNLFKTEVGRYNSFRGLTMLKLLDTNDSLNHKQAAYFAAEYFYTNGFFLVPQNFKRINLFGKYSANINSKTELHLTLSTFTSKWDASGQIPDRAIANGLITRFGSIDPTEGGNTSRTNLNLELKKIISPNTTFTNQVYLVNYNFNLFSNFTFFLNDSVNGDQINQFEGRNIFGYNGTFVHLHKIGKAKLKTTIGLGLRDDGIRNIGLAHTEKRKFLEYRKRGNIDETNASLYVDETACLIEKLTLSLGVRFDQFLFRYTDLLNDSLLPSKSKNIVSPKLNIIYSFTKRFQLYVSSGTGFHSNDARAVVYNPGTILPRAIGLDVGANLKPFKRMFINTAFWMLDLQSEFVYVGDDAVIEPSGYSRRFGIDLSIRYQILDWLFADFDGNYSHARFRDEPKGENYVPLAPVVTSIGGLSVNFRYWSGSLRYRYLGDRPAIEDNTIRANGYYVMDAVINYSREKYRISITAENMLNRKWKEAQFATTSRLKNEATPVTEIHFTPGTPLFIKAGFNYFF